MNNHEINCTITLEIPNPYIHSQTQSYNTTTAKMLQNKAVQRRLT